MLLWINGAQLPSNLLIGRKEAEERVRESGIRLKKERDGEVWRGKERKARSG